MPLPEQRQGSARRHGPPTSFACPKKSRAAEPWPERAGAARGTIICSSGHNADGAGVIVDDERRFVRPQATAEPRCRLDATRPQRRLPRAERTARRPRVRHARKGGERETRCIPGRITACTSSH